MNKSLGEKVGKGKFFCLDGAIIDAWFRYSTFHGWIVDLFAVYCLAMEECDRKKIQLSFDLNICIIQYVARICKWKFRYSYSRIMAYIFGICVVYIVPPEKCSFIRLGIIGDLFLILDEYNVAKKYYVYALSISKSIYQQSIIDLCLLGIYIHTGNKACVQACYNKVKNVIEKKLVTNKWERQHLEQLFDCNDV